MKHNTKQKRRRDQFNNIAQAMCDGLARKNRLNLSDEDVRNEMLARAVSVPRYRPSSHPGVILQEEFLKSWKMSLGQAAKQIKITMPFIKLLVAGKRSVSMRMAGLLERLTKMPKETWISLQRAHDLSVNPERHMGRTLDVQALATKGIVRSKSAASSTASKGKPKRSAWDLLRDEKVASLGGFPEPPVRSAMMHKDIPAGSYGGPPVHPGSILFKEFFIPLRIALSSAPKGMNVTLPHLQFIVEGKRPVSIRMARILEGYLGVSKEFWINLQREYDQR